MISLLSVTTLVLALVIFGLVKWWQVKRQIENVLKTNATLEQTVQQQAAEITVKNTQLRHHQTRKQNEENFNGVSRDRIIEQLHENGDLRRE